MWDLIVSLCFHFTDPNVVQYILYRKTVNHGKGVDVGSKLI